MNTGTRRIGTLGNSLLIVLSLLAAGASFADESLESRSNSISQGQGIARGSIGDGVVSFQERDALVLNGDRIKPRQSVQNSKLSNRPESAVNVDFWFFDADLILFSDFDQDGFFYGLDLAFDVDTVFTSADVYAVIYLSFEGGPWNEYVETETFTIFGASADDEYVVVSELVAGYPTGNYDVLIELYDTFDGAFVAEFGPDDTPQLSILPLEDIGRDTPPNTVVVVSSEGGGSTAWLTLLLLGTALVARRVRVTSGPTGLY